MSQHFARMITLLRKERKLSQKQVAADLGISPAVLSHYEKGIRECRLEFLVSLADYYEVSCDYLLGRTSEPSGSAVPGSLSQKREPSPSGQDSQRSYCSGQKKFLVNTLHILYDLLARYKNRVLTGEVTRALSLLLYSLFRALYSSNAENPVGIFELPKTHTDSLTDASLRLSLSHVKAEAKNGHGKTSEKIRLSPKLLYEQYPAYAPSLFALIQRSEQYAKLPWIPTEE